MGIFKKTEDEVKFMGTTLQPIGKIAQGKPVGLTLKPTEEVLQIYHDGIKITLPYNRIVGFSLENETTLANSGSGLGGAIIGGALFGGIGAIVGQQASKGKTNTKWIGTLNYKDKEGEYKSLSFIQSGAMSPYYEGEQKHFGGAQFESMVNQIATRYSEDITEL